MIEIPPDTFGDFFAHIHNGLYRDIFSHTIAVEMCDDGPVYPVRVSVDSDGTYWAWYDARQKRLSMIYSRKILLDMCFTYGPEVEEARDGGLRCRVKIESREP